MEAPGPQRKSDLRLGMPVEVEVFSSRRRPERLVRRWWPPVVEAPTVAEARAVERLKELNVRSRRAKELRPRGGLCKLFSAGCGCEEGCGYRHYFENEQEERGFHMFSRS